jgi:putative protein-disulfide isomerase
MVRIEQFDDPLNPYGWAIEPAVRRLSVAFPDLTWELHPTVLVEDWDDVDGPEFENGKQGAAATCARVSERSNMPIDEFLWFEDPPTTSAPACRAVAAALADDDDAGRRVLRALREATFIRRTNVSGTDALRSVLEDVHGVDAEAVLAALDGDDAAAAMETHREAAAAADADGVTRVGDRPQLPTLVVHGADGAQGLSGWHNYATVRGVVTDVADLDPADERPPVEAALERFSPEGWVSVTELEALAGVPHDAVAEQAGDLVAAGDAVEREFAAESFWRLAEFVDDAGAEADEEPSDTNGEPGDEEAVGTDDGA